jgi:hypothetical protein
MDARIRPSQPRQVPPAAWSPAPSQESVAPSFRYPNPFVPTPTVEAQLALATHDISLAGYHIPNRAWIERLDVAVRTAWPSRKRQQYAKVNVLMLSWASADTDTQKDVALLKSVFQRCYHYDVEE